MVDEQVANGNPAFIDFNPGACGSLLSFPGCDFDLAAGGLAGASCFCGSGQGGSCGYSCSGCNTNRRLARERRQDSTAPPTTGPPTPCGWDVVTMTCRNGYETTAEDAGAMYEEFPGACSALTNPPTESAAPASASPTVSPSSSAPSSAPIQAPSNHDPTTAPTTRTPTSGAPTREPTTLAPTDAPHTSPPTRRPTRSPEGSSPTVAPISSHPTALPFATPTTPSLTASAAPTQSPVSSPSGEPLPQPSGAPSYPAIVTPLGFDNYDSDLNGKLSLTEYMAFLAAQSATASEGFSRTGALYTFRARDADGDGSLDFLEFLATDDTPAPSAPATTASGSQPHDKVRGSLNSLSVSAIVAVTAITTALLAIVLAVCTRNNCATCRKKQPETIPAFAGTAVDPMTGMGRQTFSGSSIASMVSREPSVDVSAAGTWSYFSGARQSHQGTYLSIDAPDEEHFDGFAAGPAHHNMAYDGGASVSQANFGRAARASMRRSSFQRRGSHVGGGGGSPGDAGPDGSDEEFQGFGEDVFL